METKFSMASEVFLKTLKNEKERKAFHPFMRDFELCCILSDFDEAILLIPFDIEKYKDGLLKVHSYIRQKIIAKLSEKLLVNAVFKEDKESQDSINLLLKRISGDSGSSFGSFGDLMKAALTS